MSLIYVEHLNARSVQIKAAYRYKKKWRGYLNKGLKDPVGGNVHDF